MWNRNKIKPGGGEMRRKKGQSILEYVIVLTVVVAAIAYAATKFIGPAVKNAFEKSGDVIGGAVDKLPGAGTTQTPGTTQ